MIIPSQLETRAVMFSDGENGFAQQQFRNDEYGIDIMKERANHASNWTRVFAIDALPGKVFKTFQELSDAVKDLPQPFKA